MKEVSIHDAADVTLKPAQAIVLYRDEQGSQIYATHHGVREKAGIPYLLPGHALQKRHLAKFAAIAAAQATYQGFVPENLLYTAPNTIAWWTPASIRRVWFAADAPIGETAADVSHPPLVFVATDKDWFVFALNQTTRPGPETELHKAPYFNVWPEGRICTGNVSLPDHPGPDVIADYEHAFFRSRFTHPNDTKLIRRKGGAVRLWMDLLAGAEFPTQCLISRKRSLADTLRTIVKGE